MEGRRKKGGKEMEGGKGKRKVRLYRRATMPHIGRKGLLFVFQIFRYRSNSRL